MLTKPLVLPDQPIPPVLSPSVAPLPLLILVSMIQPTAMNMYLPAMAQMRDDLATSASAIQLTLSVFLAATAVGQLAVGPVSDIYGRRPILLGGMAVFLLGSIICILAPTVDILILGRVIQAVGSCAGLALSRAIIRDVHGTNASASLIGYVTMGMAIAPMVTPAFGGLIAEFASWRYIFGVMTAFGLLALIMAMLRLGETHFPTSRKGAFRRWAGELRELLGLPNFWLFATTLAFLCVSFFAFVAGGIFVSSAVFNLSATEYGLYFIFVLSGYVFGTFVTGRFGERIGLVRMIVIGNMIALVGVASALTLAGVGNLHPLSLFAPMLIVGIGNGFALPNAVAGAVSVRPHLAGTASGLAGAFQIGSGAIASITVGLLSDAGIWADVRWPMLVPMIVGASLSLVLSLFLRRHMIA
ncbi:multidrug effflux MFS transporter [Acuticoccus sp. M5D2P5]|uniref:multidrug effflux MFS transporter n=1 Tax=Acuticoccus kalidii TaxID=2910977 RepID=UPI001F1ADA82|nr:multidrug effflux MFS transporter [Acuticoccus kalidii]MCF3933153.1 multidrug effflux MFS transporter [Acuticoccus kalidii]